MEQKRNGEIDFFRFVFAVSVLLYHFTPFISFLNGGILKRGYIGVEFFFLVSGFLLTRRCDSINASKGNLNSLDLTSETWSYIHKKIKSFFRYYLCAFILQIVVRYIMIRHENITTVLYDLLRSIPTITLSFIVLNFNAKSLYLGNTWFLSAMIISIMILYPMMLRNYHMSVKIFFPIISLFLIGYLYHHYNSVTVIDEYNGFIYDGVTRAVAEMAFGGVCYELSKYLDNCSFFLDSRHNRFKKLICTTFKTFCYLVVLVYARGTIGGYTLSRDFDLHVFLFCAIAVTLSFSTVGYSIHDNKLTRWLGKISLPLFIYHGMFRVCWKDYLGTAVVSPRKSMFIVLSSLLISVLLMYITDCIVDHILIRKKV